MKNAITMLWVMGLISGCATNSDIDHIKSEINEVNKTSGEIKTTIVELDETISVSNLESDSAEFHSVEAEKGFLDASEKLDLIIRHGHFK